MSPRRRAEEITVGVDAGKCGSFGFCEHEAPAIFQLRSDRRLAYRSVVPADQAEAATRAAVVCPARAIKLARLPAPVGSSQPMADPTGAFPLPTPREPVVSVLRSVGGPVFGRRDRIVVVGAGAAGWSAAGELRRLGFTGELVAIGAEPVGPYDRTACSKGVLTGQQRPKDTALDLRGHPGVSWRTGLTGDHAPP